MSMKATYLVLRGRSYAFVPEGEKDMLTGANVQVIDPDHLDLPPAKNTIGVDVADMRVTEGCFAELGEMTLPAFVELDLVTRTGARNKAVIWGIHARFVASAVDYFRTPKAVVGGLRTSVPDKAASLT